MFGAQLLQASPSPCLPPSGDDDGEVALAATDVREVWGVGKKIGAQLQDVRIHTALNLRRLDLVMVKGCWSVELKREL